MKFAASGVTERGVPDIIACYRGAFVAFEVKAYAPGRKVKPSTHQQAQMERIVQSKGLAFTGPPPAHHSFAPIEKTPVACAFSKGHPSMSEDGTLHPQLGRRSHFQPVPFKGRHSW